MSVNFNVSVFYCLILLTVRRNLVLHSRHDERYNCVFDFMPYLGL